MSGGKSQEQSNQQEGRAAEPTRRTKGVQNESLQIEFQHPPSGRWATLLCEAAPAESGDLEIISEIGDARCRNRTAFRSPGNEQVVERTPVPRPTESTKGIQQKNR